MICSNYSSLLTLTILWAAILTSAITWAQSPTYHKCKNAMTEFQGACRNLSGFTTTMKMRDRAAPLQILKNLTQLIQPLEPGPVNLSIWSSRTPDIDCNDPLPYQIEFIIALVPERRGALDLYICVDGVVTLIERNIDTDFTANCICAHVWSCKYSTNPEGACLLSNDCSCRNTRDVLHTAVIKHPPQMLASFTQSRCPPTDCCMTDDASEWTSWSSCMVPAIEQRRSRAIRVKDHEPACKVEQEARSCFTTATSSELLTTDTTAYDRVAPQKAIDGEIHRIKKGQPSSSSSNLIIGIGVAVTVVVVLAIGAAMLMLAICRKKNNDTCKRETGREIDSRLTNDYKKDSIAPRISGSNMRPAIRSAMDKNVKSSTKTRSKSKLTLPSAISKEDKQHYIALTPLKRSDALPYYTNRRSVRDDTDVIIRRKTTDPCPIVVAPWSAGAGLSFGRMTNFFSSWSGYTKKTGAFDTNFGGAFGPGNGAQFGINGPNTVVPNLSKDCIEQEKQRKRADRRQTLNLG